MAWIKVEEQGHLASSSNDPNEKTALRVFIAIADAPTTPVAAETASHGGNSIPDITDEHPDDPDRLVKSKSAKPDQESVRTVFTVEVNYSSKVDGSSEDSVIENPLDRPAVVEWDFDDDKEPYFIDRDDDPDGPFPVVNSAGERFQEFLERDTGSITATITKNIGATAYDPVLAFTYKHAVNSDGFTIDGVSIDAGQAKMKCHIAGAVQTENGVSYKQVKTILQFRPTWDDVVEDRGFNELDPANDGKLKQIMKGAAPPAPVDTPWPLNGEGAKLPNSTDAPATLTFVPYFKLPFAAIDFS